MNSDVLQVQLRAVVPSGNGSALFLTDGDKTIVISVDSHVGMAITMFMRDLPKERPLTHDLIQHILTALGAKVERIIINDLKNATYYARLILSARNELGNKEKIMEIDARPSDCIALAAASGASMYVVRDVWDEAEDMSEALRQMEENAGEAPEDEEDTDE